MATLPSRGQSPQPRRAAAPDSLEALAERHGVPAIDLTQVAILADDLAILPREIAERHLILPITVREDKIHVAMANPADARAIDELEFTTGKQLAIYVAPARILTRVLDAAYQAKERGARHYTGPNCPPETLARLGIARSSSYPSPPRPQHPQPRPSSHPSPPMPRRPQSAPVRIARGLTSEISHADLGMLSADLSTVTDLSVLGKLAQVRADGEANVDPAVATILVVDDDAETRRMLARVLSDNGYRVIEADRGLAALLLVKEKIPDLIILDATLPEVHGFDIARRIKRSRKYGHIPIIMMSADHRGWRYAEDVKASCGVTAYIEKPFRISEMLETVDRALSSVESEKDEAVDGAALSAEAEQALADGVAAYRAGDIETAISHLKRGVAIDPFAYRLHLHLGLMLGKRGQIFEAMSALETAMGINPRHYPAVKNLAALYEQAGFRNKAVETWERALSIAPDEDTRQAIKEYLMELL